MQKYKEAKHLAHQVQEESFQSQESDEEYGNDDDNNLDGEDDDYRNEEFKVDLKSAIIEAPPSNKKTAFTYAS
jgi:hypothetical protein